MWRSKNHKDERFLVADTQLYKSLCPSVRPSVRPSVNTSRKVRKHAFPPLPTRPQLVLAVYPALFLSFSLYLFIFVFLCNTVEPCSNGPAFNRIPPTTDTVSWSFELIFFYSPYWLWQNNNQNSLVLWNPLERDLTVHIFISQISMNEWNAGRESSLGSNLIGPCPLVS